MIRKKILIDPMISQYQIDDSTIFSDNMSKSINLSRNNSNNAIEPLTKNDMPPPISSEGEIIEPTITKQSDKNIEDELLPDYMREAQKSGMQDAMKESVKEHRKNTFKFFGLMNKSEKLVAKFKNIIPFFTDEVVIDTTKVTFIHRPFFFSERIHSVSVKDISDVFVETAPFFAALKIVDANFIENTIQINWFLKKDAEKARRIITGLMTASKEQVDLNNIEDDGLDAKLEEIGRTRGVSTSVSKA